MYYKIFANGKVDVSSIYFDGYIEFDMAKPSEDLMYALLLEVEKTKQIVEAKEYLNKTDFYYARFLETSEHIPLEIIERRKESREFIRTKQ